MRENMKFCSELNVNTLLNGYNNIFLGDRSKVNHSSFMVLLGIFEIPSLGGNLNFSLEIWAYSENWPEK